MNTHETPAIRRYIHTPLSHEYNDFCIQRMIYMIHRQNHICTVHCQGMLCMCQSHLLRSRVS